MKRESFNPGDWLPKKQKSFSPPVTYSYPETDNHHEVEKIIQRIESRRVDIAPDYLDWVRVGFAFAVEFGELGRSFFHRVSRFHIDYHAKECNDQYDSCLGCGRSGVSIRTFFYLAREAGICIKRGRG